MFLLFLCLVLCFYCSSAWSCVSIVLLFGSVFPLFFCMVLCFHCSSAWFCVSTVPLYGSVFPLFLCMALCFHCSSVDLVLCFYCLPVWFCVSTVLLSGPVFPLFLWFCFSTTTLWFFLCFCFLFEINIFYPVNCISSFFIAQLGEKERTLQNLLGESDKVYRVRTKILQLFPFPPPPLSSLLPSR